MILLILRRNPFSILIYIMGSHVGILCHISITFEIIPVSFFRLLIPDAHPGFYSIITFADLVSGAFLIRHETC